MPIPESKANISSSSSHVEKPRQYIKMGTYNGKTSVDAFLRKFEVCSKNNGWSDDEKLNQLTCALTEPASQLLWEFDSNTVATWSDLVNKLRLRYGSSDQASLYQTQLNTRRQKEGEDLGLVPRSLSLHLPFGDECSIEFDTATPDQNFHSVSEAYLPSQTM